jgi:iron complex outermembrane receptor protein
MLTKHLALATTALVCTFAGTAAFAQSTGSNTVSEIVVTGKKSPDLGGVVTQQEAPKTREIVSQQYISNQPTGANALSDLNLIPGVNYTQDDPYGMAGGAGHFSIRGIKGANVGELVDGVPLNDAGNYAISPGELVDPETIANVNVITGSTDVDAPLSSSLGGLVDINTLVPTDKFGGFVTLAGGDDDYLREGFLVNSGEFGPFGTKMWVEASNQLYRKFTNSEGTDRKQQVNAKIYQDLHHSGDFIAVSGFLDNQVAPLYDGVNFADFCTSTKTCTSHPATGVGPFAGMLSTPWNSDYNRTYQSYKLGATPPSGDSSFWGLEQNPTKTGNIRGESRFTLLPNLKLTFDPSYQWVLANGGGSTVIKENDPRLIDYIAGTKTAPAIGGLTTSKSNFPACYTNGVVTGLDLDGNTTAGGAPVCTDSVRLSSPSNTQTDRITLNTSVIWDITPEHLIQFAYAYDHANVRQTGEYGLINNATGMPDTLWGGLQGYGSPIISADGTIFQKRNRQTIADLNQVSLEYIGKFFDDHLRVDLGARDPFLSRNLSNDCYTQPPSNVYCTSNQAVAVAEGYNVLPFKLHTSYDKPLPNVGFTWHFNPASSVFFDYTTAMNAPVNDDLYSIAVVGSGSTVNAVGKDNVQPETSTTYELGYRYQTPTLKSTLDVFKLEDNNHIVTSYNQTSGDTVDQNVGTLSFYGVEGLIGVEPLPHWTVAGSFTWEHGVDENNIPYSSTLDIPTKGKTPTDMPQIMYGALTSYELGDVTFDLQGKFVGGRYVTLVNDLRVPSYITFDGDIRWRLKWLPQGSWLQLNVINILDEKYIGSINQTDTNNGSSPYYSYAYAYQGTPRTVQVSLRAAF